MTLETTAPAVAQSSSAAAGFGPAGGAARLAAVGVTKSWEQRVILDRVDLSVEPGALVGLLGANGVGKTTFLRILAGVIWAADGTVTLDGFDIQNDERAYKARLGFVSAGQTGLYARLTTQEQLDTGPGSPSCRGRFAGTRWSGRSSASACRSFSRGASTACRWGSASAYGSRWAFSTDRPSYCSTSRRRASIRKG